MLLSAGVSTRQLPKLIFRDKDLPTLRYRRCQTSETEQALRDVGRTLDREVREERVEILGLVSPEAGLAAEIADLCTLDIVKSIELPLRSYRLITPDDLPAIPITEPALRRAQRRHTTRIAIGVTLGLLLGFVGAATFVGFEPPSEESAPAASAVAGATHTTVARIVPSPPVIEAIVENSPAPPPVGAARLVVRKALASRRPVRRTGPAALRTPTPSRAQAFRPPAPRKRRGKRVSKSRLNELDDLLGL